MSRANRLSHDPTAKVHRTSAKAMRTSSSSAWRRGFLQITQAQAENLRRMVVRFRRQIPRDVVALAELAAPGVEARGADRGAGPLFGAP